MKSGRAKGISSARPLFVWSLSAALALTPVFRPSPAAATTVSSEIGACLFTSTVSWQAARRVYVVAHMTLPADVERVWAVLTDYDNLAEYMPHLDKSEVLERDSGRLKLRQAGSLWFPLVRLKSEAVMEVRESPPQMINFKATEGDYEIYEGRWRLQPTPEGTDLFYEAVIEPRFRVPRFLLSAMERKIMKGTFEAVLVRSSEPGEIILAKKQKF